jgi:hypothetical protein
LAAYFVVIETYTVVAYRRRLRRRALDTPPRAANVDVTYTVTGPAWRTATIYVVAEFSWQRYTHVVELADQFLLMESRGLGHVLPKAGLSADDLIALRTFLAGLELSAAPRLEAWRPPVAPGMRIDIAALFDLRLRAAGLRHILRRAIRRSVLIAAVYAAFAALLIAADPSDLRSDAVLGLVITWAVFRVLRSLSWPGRLARRLQPRLRTGSLLTLTDSGFHHSDELSRSAMRWESFVGAHELPGQILLMVARNAFHSVPIDGLSLQDLQTLRTFLANRDWRVALRAAQPEPAGQ